MMSIQELMGMALDYFDDLRVIDVDASTHSKFNRIGLNVPVGGAAEILIIGRN